MEIRDLLLNLSACDISCLSTSDSFWLLPFTKSSTKAAFSIIADDNVYFVGEIDTGVFLCRLADNHWEPINNVEREYIIDLYKALVSLDKYGCYEVSKNSINPEDINTILHSVDLSKPAITTVKPLACLPTCASYITYYATDNHSLIICAGEYFIHNNSSNWYLKVDNVALQYLLNSGGTNIGL